jgi:hypothetical protein
MNCPECESTNLDAVISSHKHAHQTRLGWNVWNIHTDKASVTCNACGFEWKVDAAVLLGG